jgi:hypothetical protein
MSIIAPERRLDERRGPVRRRTDMQRALLEETLRELPRYFVSYVDKQKGVYTFYLESTLSYRAAPIPAVWHRSLKLVDIARV